MATNYNPTGIDYGGQVKKQSGGYTRAGQPRDTALAEPVKVMVGNQAFYANNNGELDDLNWRAEQVKKQQPTRPEWDRMIGDNGLIKPGYELSLSANDFLNDDQGFNKFQKEALRDGPSTWAELTMKQREMDRQDQIGSISNQYQMGLQNSMDQMASQGGLMTGAAERMGANSIRDLLAARQGARRDFNRDKLNIQTQDEQNRVNQLQSLTGMEADRNRTLLTAKEFDITNAMKDRDAKRQWDMDLYKQDMETWAANKQADAQASAGGGCFPRGTLVDMADGSKKPIEQIQVGDVVAEGGEVTKTLIGSARGTSWYEYKKVIVAGDHAVFENGSWIRVHESDDSALLDLDFETLYNISNENHEMIVGGVVFSDFDEVDDQRLSDEECLILKNKGVYV